MRFLRLATRALSGTILGASSFASAAAASDAYSTGNITLPFLGTTALAFSVGCVVAWGRYKVETRSNLLKGIVVPAATASDVLGEVIFSAAAGTGFPLLVGHWVHFDDASKIGIAMLGGATGSVLWDLALKLFSGQINISLGTKPTSGGSNATTTNDKQI